jgi:hypothetical protein
MPQTRLELIAPELPAGLAHLPEPQLRGVALAAATFALEQTGLDDPVLGQALAAVRQDRRDDPGLRGRVESLVDTLDERQFELQEAVDNGEGDKVAQSAAFARARAANAVFYALDPDAFTAATDVLYEAYAATGDLERVRELAHDPAIYG